MHRIRILHSERDKLMNRYYLQNALLSESDIDREGQFVIEADSVNDGYHTMDQLYEHRHALFCALCKIYDNYITPFNTRVHCWKSKSHHDGTMFEGWFIVGMTITKFTGPVEYITYHLPMSWWDKFKLIEMEKAPQWDGHTSNDVLERLLKL